MNFLIKNRLLIFSIFLFNGLFAQFPNPASLSSGQGAIGTLDPIWLVSDWFPYPGPPPNPVTGGVTYTSAFIDNNCAPGSWINPATLAPPLNTSNWITNPSYPCASNINAGYMYYRLELNLPADCNGFSVTTAGSYVLNFSGYVDNRITDVFVNGASMGITGGSFAPGGQINFSLPGPWVAGINYIDVLIENFGVTGDSNPFGLLLVANNNNSDIDNDGVNDIDDNCVCEPGSGIDGCCPDLIVSNDTTVCSGDNLTIMANDNGLGNTSAMYSWSDGQIGQNISVSPTTTTIYTATLNGSKGCIVTEDIVVTVVDNVTTSFTSSNYCVYEEVQFTDNSTITSPDMLVNSGWDFGDASQDIGNQVTHQYTSAGTYVVSHAVSTINGCTGTAIENITVYDAPIADFNFLDACANKGIDFEDNSAGAGTTVINWEWDFADGSSPGSNGTETHTYTISGNYDVQLIVEDNEGCRDTALKAVTIFEDPTAGFTFSDVCLYDSVNLIDVSTITAPDNIVSWSWDINNNGSEDYSTQNANHKFSSPGSYDVKLITLSNNNCSNSVTETVNIFPVPQAGFSASTVCVNGAATDFVNTSTLSQGNIVLYGWNFGDGNFSTLENPINNYQIASSYPVTLGVVSDLGCADSVTFSIEVLGKPSAAFSQDTTNGCAPLCVAFTDTSYDDVPILEWNWKFESSYGESSEQSPSYCYETTGDYNVGLIVKNSQGCKDTLEQIGLITVFPKPVSDFTLNPINTDVLNSTIDFTNNSIDAAAWIWDFGDGTEQNLIDYSPSHLYADTGNLEVQLIVINAFLCTDTSYQTVEILPVDELFVPSGFSPNGDGKNDVLYARGYIGTMYFAVFDRLGKKVFESEDKETGWDGMINGKNALEGVYSWFLQAEVNGTAYKQKGDVTLVR
jgi:gliding motility-associated-like protein